MTRKPTSDQPCGNACKPAGAGFCSSSTPSAARPERTQRHVEGGARRQPLLLLQCPLHLPRDPSARGGAQKEALDGTAPAAPLCAPAARPERMQRRAEGGARRQPSLSLQHSAAARTERSQARAEGGARRQPHAERAPGAFLAGRQVLARARGVQEAVQAAADAGRAAGALSASRGQSGCAPAVAAAARPDTPQTLLSKGCRFAKAAAGAELVLEAAQWVYLFRLCLNCV